jgi:hypothetical protein
MRSAPSRKVPFVCARNCGVSSVGSARPQPAELAAAPNCLKAAIIARGFLASVVL